MGGHNNIELEHFAAGLQRQLTAHIRWLRTSRAFWGSLQRSLVHELQVSLNAGAILQWMVSQAMLYARGMAPPNRAYVEDPYPPLNAREAARASQRLVDEITIHCDTLRLMQSFSGEAIAHDERVRSHLARMESSPIRRVRQRTEVGPGNATVTSRGSTTSSTAMAPPGDNQSATTERHHHMGQVAQTRDDSDCPRNRSKQRGGGHRGADATKPQAETGITGTRPPAGGVHRLLFMENFAAAEGDTTCYPPDPQSPKPSLVPLKLRRAQKKMTKKWRWRNPGTRGRRRRCRTTNCPT